jgi:hypothetical protein
MKTLRKELRDKFEDVIRFEAVFCFDGLELESPYKEMIASLAERLADAACTLRAFQETADEEYKSVAESFDLEQSDIAWTIAAGKEVTQKQVNKQAEIFEFETMICKELARLPYNFEGDFPKEQDSFRVFLKAKRKLGQELETWVNWWMSDEWRVANPPWKLTAIKVKWLEAFKTTSETPVRPEYQKFVAPAEDDFIPNPKAKK